MGSLRFPLAASLLLHAAVLGLLGLSLPRGVPEPEAPLQVHLVSLEAEGGNGFGLEGLAPRPAMGTGAPVAPAGAPPVAAPHAPPPAPPRAPAAVADAAPREALPVEGLKDPVPEPSVASPSRLETPVGSPVAGEVIPRQGPAGLEGAPPPAGLGAGPAGSFTGAEGGAGGGAAGAFGGLKRESPGLGGQGSGPGGSAAFAEILRRIEAAKHYPEQARRFGHRGTVAVRFRVAPDGAVAAAEVVGSSGSPLLDAASLETVRRAAPLPRIAGWLRVRISYGLAEARP